VDVIDTVAYAMTVDGLARVADVPVRTIRDYQTLG